MKKIIPLVASLLLTVMVNAQDLKQPQPPKPPTVEERLQHFSERLDKDASLSKEQKQKVLAAYKDFFSKMDELHAKFPPPPPPPPPAEMKEEMDKLVAEKDNNIKSILTDEQFKRLKEIEAGHHGRKGEMPPPPPPPKTSSAS